MLLVAVGIMGSLSFFNCYAMEKSNDVKESNEISTE